MKDHEYVLQLSSQARRQINRLPIKIRDAICQRISLGSIRIFIYVDEERKQILIEAVTQRKSTYGRGNFVAGTPTN